MSVHVNGRAGRPVWVLLRQVMLAGAGAALAACSQPGDPARTGASAAGPLEERAETANCPGYSPGHKQVFWGDLHVHTAYSLDAYGFGTLRTPAEAYRFAKGYPVASP